MTLELWQYLTLTCVGVIAGWLNVMAGGGSMLTIPVMLFFGIPGPVANGTNRIAILAQNVSASLAFFKSGFKDYRLAISLSLAAIPGAVVGASIGVSLEGVWFERLLAVIMVLVMVLMATGKKPNGKAPEVAIEDISKKRMVAGHLLMALVGVWGGFIQIGVGFLLMPVLHRVLGIDLVRVNALKVFVVLCYTVVAMAIFASQVQILWIAGAALAVGNAIGGWLGAHSTITKGENLIRWVLNLVLVAFIIKLLFF